MRNWFKQFFCIHDWEYKELDGYLTREPALYCTKCDKTLRIEE